MKILTVLLIIALLSPISLSGQMQLLVNEDFLDNRNGWVTSDNPERIAKIENGFYYLTYSNPDYYYFYWNQLVDLARLQTYIIELKFYFLYTSPNSSFGFFWDSDPMDNTTHFFITPKKYFYVQKQIDGSYSDITDWLQCQCININNNKPNIIRIYKNSGTYSLYINGNFLSKVSVLKAGGIKGSKLGFILSDSIGVAIDYIKIYGIKPKLNLVPNPINAKKENLGPHINTPYLELSPYITPDGSKLYFVRRGDPRNIGQNKNNDDIWVSYKTENGWSSAIRLNKPFNDEHHNSIIYASPDGNMFIVSALYDRKGNFISTSGLSIIYKLPNGNWSNPQPVIITDYINEWEFKKFNLSADRSVLLFSAIIPEYTFGDADIYVSFLQEDGTYSSPINLGPQINTAFTEGTPFLAPDGLTLYFSSDGHPGYGSRDIFVARRLDETWTNWTTPQNLGPSVNSQDWDGYFTIDAKGEYAYLVSEKNAIGQLDLFRIKLNEEAQPTISVFISGKVIDSITSKPVYAQVGYYTNENQNYIATTLTDPNSGNYKLVLPAGKQYTITASAKGYLPAFYNLDATNYTISKFIKINFLLKPIKIGEKFILQNIYFPAGKAVFLPQSYNALKNLLMFMKLNPNVKIEVAGHTNNIGDRQKLIELSIKRAKAVKKYLVDNGISPDRIKTVGYGPDKPIASNKTPEGRKLNQRVEIRIIEN